MSEVNRTMDEHDKRLIVSIQGLLSVAGIDVKIVNHLPTEVVEIYEKHVIDHLYELEDETLLHIEFRNSVTVKDSISQMECYVSLCQKHQKQIRSVVIFESEVQVDEAITEVDLGAIKFRVEPVFSSNLNGDDADRIKQLIGRRVQSVHLNNNGMCR